jgi:hypothetical protein
LPRLLRTYHISEAELKFSESPYGAEYSHDMVCFVL